MKKIYSILTILLLTSCLNLLMNDTPDEDEKKQEQIDPGNGEDKGYKELGIEDKYSDYVLKRMDIPNTTTDIKIDGNNLYYTIKFDIHDQVNSTSVLGVMDITDPDNPKNLKSIGDLDGLSDMPMGDGGNIDIDNGYIIVTNSYRGGSFIYDLDTQMQLNFLTARIGHVGATTVHGATHSSVVFGNKLYTSFVTDGNNTYKFYDLPVKRGVVIHDLNNLDSYNMNSIPPAWSPSYGLNAGSVHMDKDGSNLYMSTIRDGYILKTNFSSINVQNGDHENFTIQEVDTIKTGYYDIKDILITDEYLLVLYYTMRYYEDSSSGLLVYSKNDNIKLYDISFKRDTTSIKADDNYLYIAVNNEWYKEGSSGGIMVLNKNNLADYASETLEPKVYELGVYPLGFDVKGNRAYVASGQTPTIADITIVKLD